VDPQIEFVTALLRRAIDRGGERIEVEVEAEEAWTAELLKMGDAILGTDRGWYRGGRLPGKPRVLTLFPGGLTEYRQRADEAEANDYAGFRFTPADASDQVPAAAPPPAVHWAS